MPRHEASGPTENWNGIQTPRRYLSDPLGTVVAGAAALAAAHYARQTYLLQYAESPISRQLTPKLVYFTHRENQGRSPLGNCYCAMSQVTIENRSDVAAADVRVVFYCSDDRLSVMAPGFQHSDKSDPLGLPGETLVSVDVIPPRSRCVVFAHANIEDHRGDPNVCIVPEAIPPDRDAPYVHLVYSEHGLAQFDKNRSTVKNVMNREIALSAAID